MRNSKDSKDMKRRIRRFIVHQVNSFRRCIGRLRDPRHASWVRIPLTDIVMACLYGLLGNCRTPRDVEAMLKEMFVTGSAARTVSDSTLYSVCQRLDPWQVRDVLVTQVRGFHRMHALRPVGLPLSVCTVDGKCLVVTDHDANGWGQAHHDPATGKVTHHLVRAVRATLTSAAGKPCIDQMPIPADTNDMGVCIDFVRQLHDTYGEGHGNLFEVLDFDAGFCSELNARTVDGLGCGYVFGLKAGEPTLLEEAQRLLLPRLNGTPDAETNERRDGLRFRRRLVRTADIAGYHDWHHLRQAWLVRQEKLDAKGNVVETEDRFFLSNLPWNRLKHAEILLLVRNHWGIENNTFNSLDVQWREDSGVWCTKGHAPYVLGLLRLVAYNVVQHLRCRHLVPRHVAKPPDLIPWRRLFEQIRFALILPLDVLDRLAAQGL